MRWRKLISSAKWFLLSKIQGAICDLQEFLRSGASFCPRTRMNRLIDSCGLFAAGVCWFAYFSARQKHAINSRSRAKERQRDKIPMEKRDCESPLRSMYHRLLQSSNFLRICPSVPTPISVSSAQIYAGCVGRPITTRLFPPRLGDVDTKHEARLASLI